MAQADKMRAKATKTVAAQNMARAPSGCSPASRPSARRDKVAKLRFPEPGAVRQDAAAGDRAVASPTARWRSSPTSTWPSTAARSVVVLGLNGAGKTTLLRMLAGVDTPDTGQVEPGHGLQARLLRPGARDPRRRPHGAREHEVGRARPRRDRGAQGARLVPVHRRRRRTSRPGVLSGGEKTRLALAMLVVSAANVLLLDEPTNNLDPASPRGDPRRAAHLRGRRRAGHRTTRAPSRRSSPSASCCCPTASRTCWSADYLDLVTLA